MINYIQDERNGDYGWWAEAHPTGICYNETRVNAFSKASYFVSGIGGRYGS
jgi:hypothetical protein